jgi:hypothetical protein
MDHSLLKHQMLAQILDCMKDALLVQDAIAMIIQGAQGYSVLRLPAVGAALAAKNGRNRD